MLNLSEIRNKHYSHQRGKLINMDADIDDWLPLIIVLKQEFILNYLHLLVLFYNSQEFCKSSNFSYNIRFTWGCLAFFK